MIREVAQRTSGLVDIVREFFGAHQLMRELFARFRAEELLFTDLGQLISDDEDSVLFRLKERCHALFRSGGESARGVHHREALFDLAVGSLFHEAMKFRENFYQSEIYGPRVRALRDEAGAEAKSLFQEFERMLATGTEQLEGGLRECELLLSRTRDQLLVLLRLHRDDGFVARYLVEQPELVASVCERPLDAFLAELHGDAALGYALAGRSYLDSGYYAAAERAFRGAIERGGDPAENEPLCAYARGMGAYLVGDYRACVAELGRWLEAGGPGSPELQALARGAVSRIGQLAAGADRQQVAEEARVLAERMRTRPDATAG
jgi:hypothetical protein